MLSTSGHWRRSDAQNPGAWVLAGRLEVPWGATQRKGHLPGIPPHRQGESPAADCHAQGSTSHFRWWGERKAVKGAPGLRASARVTPALPHTWRGTDTETSLLVLGRGPSLGAFLVAQMVKNPPAMWETWVHPWVGNIPWRSKWLPTPVLWPGESHGQRSLAGYSPWGLRESDMTERLSF